MRPRRVLAVAWRDLRRVGAGRSGWRLLLLAAGLLGPAAVIPVPERAPARVAVAGEIPEALSEHLVPDAGSAVRLSREAGRLHVEAPRIRRPLRAALDTLPGPTVHLGRPHPEASRPGSPHGPWGGFRGRGVFVVLLALSLLTGPLAEALAGEREAGTWSTLRVTGLTLWEIVAGKWLAWSAAASVVALLATTGGLLSGAQPLFAGLLALPAVLGLAVGLGLWLTRHAADLVGGTTAPMRVLPPVAILLMGLAWGLARVDPALAGLVPLGGALLAAAGVDLGAGGLILAVLTSLGATLLLLQTTARAIERPVVLPPGLDTPRLLLALALAWWVPVVGPAAWELAGAAEVGHSDAAGLLAGSALILWLALSRDGAWLSRPRANGGGVASGSTVRAVLQVLAGAGLVGLGLFTSARTGLPVAWLEPGAWTVVLERSGLGGPAGTPVAGLPVLLTVVLAQELVFRGWLQQRLGALSAGAAWVVICSVHDPLGGLVTALACGWLAGRHGPLAAAAARAAAVAFLALAATV